MRVRPTLVTLSVATAALVMPGVAWAHSRAPTVAIDCRFRLDRTPAGVQARILDGDRALKVTADPGVTLVVRGYLREPELRFDGGGIWVNAASPTASADRLVPAGGHGWVQLSGGRSLASHEHRLAPGGNGGRFRIPIVVDGDAAMIQGSFVRVPKPRLWPWLVGAFAALAAIIAATGRRSLRIHLVLGLGMLGGLAALAATIAFSLRDQTTGSVGWIGIGTALGIALLFAVILVRSTGRRRAYAAGIAGVAAAASTLASLPVFWHGVVISAVPATAARLACALALLAGTAAPGITLLPDFDE